MLTLINFLIVFFGFLILYQIFLANYKPLILEGMMDVVPTISPTFTPTAAPSNQMLPNLTINQVYRQYDKKIADNTFLLAQQNAGNIEVLKGRIDEFDGVNKRVDNMQQSIELMQTQIDGLVQQQADYAQEIAGSTPPEITGTGTEDEDEDVL